jgi:DNA replication protein DnaC
MDLKNIIPRQEKTDSSSNKNLITDPNFNIDQELFRVQKIGERLTNKDFIINSDNIRQFNLGIQYFNGKPEFEKNGLSLRKGLMLLGGVGTGKTIFMKVFKSYVHEKRINKEFRIENADDIVELYENYGNPGINFFRNNYIESGFGFYIQNPQRICIDDLGIEKDSVKFYGNEESVISRLLYARYNHFQRGITTHVTANLDQKMLAEKYGDRLYSRFKEMFNIIILNGEDRRK